MILQFTSETVLVDDLWTGGLCLRGTSIIRRIWAVQDFILAGNLLCWAACKTSFGGEQHVCQECDLPFFPLLMYVQDTELLGRGAWKINEFVPCGFVFLIYPAT